MPSARRILPADLAVKVEQTLSLIREQCAQAVRPAVLSSFGKDSLVLLHLVRQVREDVEILWFRTPQVFPRKDDHAWRVIQKWNLRAYDFLPRAVIFLQVGRKVDALYAFGPAGQRPFLLHGGARPRHPEEKEFACAVKDFCNVPLAPTMAWPWDVVFKKAVGREVSTVAAAQATLLMLAWVPESRGPLPRGASRQDIQAIFPEWQVIDEEAANVFGAPRFVQKAAPRFYRLGRG